MTQDPIVVVGIARTAIGNFQGVLSPVTAPQLGAAAIKAAIANAKLKADMIDEVIMGCVLSAGLGQAPARQAALNAGLTIDTPATMVNKMCASGMKATMLAHDMLYANKENIFVAGGFESMSNAPYLLPKARFGYRMGHAQVLDHMFLDGLEDAYHKGQLMGVFAENTAKEYGFSRQQQDQFAIQSIEKAQKAWQEGRFQEEIIGINIEFNDKKIEIKVDESQQKIKTDKIPHLKPAFQKDGTVTSANSSSISDGAAALVLMRASKAEKLGLTPIAKVLGHATHAQDPKWFTTAPVGAIQKLQQKLNWENNDVDLYEINEAFAVVTMVAVKTLSLDAYRVNVHGGACALGHPIGASGARIIVTLLSALKQHRLKRGIASLCIGGGEACAMAFELM